MKKILFLITKAEIGGAQKYVLDCAEGAQSAGFSVAVASERNSYLHDELSALGIPFLEVKNMQRAINAWQDIQLLKELFSLIKKEKPDILHLNSSKIGAVGAIAGRLAGVKKIVFTAHGWVFNEPRPAWEKLAFILISRFAARFQDIIICVSEYDRKMALHYRVASPEKLVTIYNGIDVRAIPFLSKQEAREKLAIGEDAFVIGTIANFYKTKSLDTLVFAAISSANLDRVRFVIIGEGPEKEKVERLIEKYQLKEHFILPGAVKNANTYLKALDVFVLPSKKEALPYALLEAMAAKLPCVVSDAGGIPEIIENERNGIIIKHITPGKLWNAIASLMKERKKAREFGARAHETVEKHSSRDTMYAKTIALYHAETKRKQKRNAAAAIALLAEAAKRISRAKNK